MDRDASEGTVVPFLVRGLRPFCQRRLRLRGRQIMLDVERIVFGNRKFVSTPLAGVIDDRVEALQLAFPLALDLPADGCSGSRSEEHTSDLQSLMRNSYAVFCLNNHRAPRHPAQPL